MDRAWTRKRKRSMRSPPVCERSRAVGRAGRAASGRSPRFPSDLRLLEYWRRQNLQSCPKLFPSPTAFPSSPAGAACVCLLSNQELFGWLCLSVLRGCYGSCFRRAFPANRRGFRVSLVPSTVLFSEAVGAQGQRLSVHGLTLPARPARPCRTHMLVPPREILTFTLSAPIFFALWLPAGLSVSGLETLS